jgi:hypothetical protein
MHGGASPGAPKGNRHAFKHGRNTAKAVAERREFGALLRERTTITVVGLHRLVECTGFLSHAVSIQMTE